MADLLREIVARRKEDLDRRDMSLDSDIRKKAGERSEETSDYLFRKSLAMEGTRIIAEIKSASPSAGMIEETPDVAAIAEEYVEGGAAAISIVTEPHYFHGSTSWIRRARKVSGLPVVMKDFVVDPIQVAMAVRAGADALLLLASILSTEELASFVDLLEVYGRDALVEVHDEEELEKAIDAKVKIIGVNNRDLRTFDVDLSTAERLGERIPEGVIRVSESGITDRNDIERLERAGYRAFLIGETLMRSDDRSATLKLLRGVG